jgi:hypothetical protein
LPSTLVLWYKYGTKYFKESNKMATIVILDSKTRKEIQRVELIGKGGNLSVLAAKSIAPGTYCKIECSKNSFFDVNLKVTSCDKEGDAYKIGFIYNFK